MKKAMSVVTSCSFAFLFMVSSSFATKPGEDVNPNGFPSGPHFNLNIIGKKSTFACPEQLYYLRVTENNSGDDDLGQLVETCDEGDVCEETDIPIYGNTVFIPEDGTPIELYIQSGTGKKYEAITELRVIDTCSGFPGEGAAVVELPKCDAGYRVYARALAKPTDDPSINLLATEPRLTTVQDEDGNDLVYIGSFGSNGFETFDGRIFRTKGKSKALDISDMFKWSGVVCDFGAVYAEPCVGDPDGDGTMNTSPLIEGVCPDGYLPFVVAVCGSEDTNGDGLPDDLQAPLEDGGCSEGYSLWYGDLASCKVYEYPTWVFSIEAFVEYLWGLDNDGLKHLQVRFYPDCAF